MDMLFKPPLIIGGSAERRRYPLSPRIYSCRSDKREVYRLRYRAFHEAGWIKDDPTGEFHDAFDEIATAYSIGLFYKDDCVGALRLAFGGRNAPQGAMPCESVFADDVARLTAGQTAKMVEFSRMALEPRVEAKTFRAVIYGSLVRAGLILAYAAEADYALAAVHQKTSRFYELMCGFGFIAGSERYGDIAEPTCLLGRDFGMLDRRRRARNAFFRILPEEIAAAKDVLSTFEAEHIRALPICGDKQSA